MNKRSLLLLPMLMIALLSMLSVPVHAKQPMPVSGSFDYTFMVTGTKEADGNTFIYAEEYETWVGDLEGTAVARFRVEQFSSGFWNVWLRSEFTGTVLGLGGTEEDTLVIQLVGKKPDGGDWYGQWVIISGTGELANAHGRGTWWGPGFGNSPAIYYSGQIQ